MKTLTSVTRGNRRTGLITPCSPGSLLLIVAAFAVWSTGENAGAATLTSSAELTLACGASEPVGSGGVTFTLDVDNCLANALEDCEVSYALSYSGLSSNATAADLHTAGKAGCAGGETSTALGVTEGTSGFVQGSITLDQAMTNALFAGGLSVVIHTEQDVDGEISGEPTKDPDPKVPALSEWSLIAFALLLLSVGAALIAKRRQLPTA